MKWAEFVENPCKRVYNEKHKYVQEGNNMATFSYKPQGVDPKGRPRVYFTCHPEDFDLYFEKIKEDILKTHDCTIYYTEDMMEALDQADLETDLGRMNLFVVPVTFRLLTQPNRAMDFDLAYAKEKNIPILPFMMEPDIDEFYSRPEKFGERQYLNPCSHDVTEIRYEDKLKKYLESVLISDEMVKRIQAAFDTYIFLSYRKKDRRHANELMKLIHKNPRCRDIAIWYDEFLTPGDSFLENIQKALEKSEVFALLVTPSLLEDQSNGQPNFVMAEEYPAARRASKDILPAEMERTDMDALRAKFEELPDCVDPRNDAAFNARLLQSIERIAKSSNDDDPEHNFLIGLAYLEGIDVEVDQARAGSMIIGAAEAELPEAMEKLIHMYTDGVGVQCDQEKTAHWSQKLADYYFGRSFSESVTINDPNMIRELFTHYEDPYWFDVIKRFLLKADRFADSLTISELYSLLESFGIREYTLLFEACRDMTNHKEETQLILVSEIIQKSVNGVYPPYGPLFWYIPEYALYETALKVAWHMKGNAKVAALVRDVCFIFGQYDCVTDVTATVDGAAVYNEALAQLKGVRRALCELFYTGHTDYDDGDDLYPRCFNVAEAKQLARTGMGLGGHMQRLFQDDLGLFTVTKADEPLSGIVILPYDDHVEEFLSGNIRFVRGMIFLNTDNIFFDYLEFYRKNIEVMYIPENCSEYSAKFAQHLKLALSLKVQPVHESAAGKTFISASHMYIRKHVRIPDQCTGIEDRFFQNCTSLEQIDFPSVFSRGVAVIDDETVSLDDVDDDIWFDDKEPRLGEACFQNCTGLSSVELPANVLTIGPRAFRDCRNLEKVDLPKKLRTVGAEAFLACVNLRELVFKRRVRIENYAFAGCDNLVRVHFQDGVDSIGMHAFAECKSLTEINFPQGISSIMDYAFSESGLKHLFFPEQTGCGIPENIPEMYWPMLKLGFGSGAFSHCTELEEVVLPGDLEEIPLSCFLGCKKLRTVCLPKQLERIAAQAFWECESLTAITLPNGLESIGDNAFICCALDSIDIPQSVQRIGDHAFRGNEHLKTIRIVNPETKIGKGVFAGCSNLTHAILPESMRGKDLGLPPDCKITWLQSSTTEASSELCIQGLRVIPAGAYRERPHLRHLEIKDAVGIDEYAFYGCSALESICVPTELTKIGDWAFANCGKLSHVPFLPQIETLCAGAFENCADLTSVSLNEKITSIEGWTFAGCTKLKQVQLPPSLKKIHSGAFKNCRELSLTGNLDCVTEIGEEAFEGCAAMTSLSLPAAEVILDHAFTSCSSLVSIELGSTLCELGIGVFENCTSLKTMDLSRTALDSIPESGFQNCLALEEITLPPELRVVGQEAFLNCPRLRRLTIPDNALSDIDSAAFAGCGQLESIEIPYVKYLSNGVFFRCEKLVSVRLSPEIKSIGTAAFALCGALRHIQLGEHLEKIGEGAFCDCSSLQSIRIPLNVETIGDDAFARCSALSSIEISRNFEDDIERIFGQIDRKIVRFIGTGDAVHISKNKPAEKPTAARAAVQDPAAEDEKVGEAIALLFEKDYITVAMLQRKMVIGYARANGLVQALLAKGIVRYDSEYKRYVPLTDHDAALQMF